MSPELRSIVLRGHAWMERGNLSRAQQLFLEALNLNEYHPAIDEGLLSIARNESNWSEARISCERGLANYPQSNILHKGLVDALIATKGIESALERYELEPIGNHLRITPDDIVGCTTVRNEIDRLPWFLQESRRQGVGPHLVVDNGSTDGTFEFLRQSPDVELWSSPLSFTSANFGSAWFEIILRHRCRGNWAAMLDVDEVLCFPDYENLPLRSFCDKLDHRGLRASSGILIDMYSDRPLLETNYLAGQSFIETSPYFDRVPYRSRTANSGPYGNQTLYEGGLRSRVFESEITYWLTKTPLIKYDTDVTLVGGQHFTSLPTERILHDGCAVLHFKYFSSFAEYSHLEAIRGEHSSGGAQYKAYSSYLNENSNPKFYDPYLSERFTGSQQLVKLGLMCNIN